MNLKEWAQTNLPSLLKEWDYEKNAGLKPEQFVPGSGKRVWWKCPVCGYSWPAPIRKRAAGHSCPCCKNKVFVRGVNDLLTKQPELCKEWDYEKNKGLTPDMFCVSSTDEVWWKCKNDSSHSWKAQITRRVRGSGCHICAKNTLVVGSNDLATVKPLIAAEWNYEKNAGLLPRMFTPSSTENVWWKCSKCGKEWQTTISSRKIPGCRECNRFVAASKRKETLLSGGKNSLATCKPLIAAEWNYDKNGDLAPDMLTANSGKRVWWKCSKCGTEWESSIDSRNQPHCRKCIMEENGEKLKKILLKKNGSLLSRFPSIAADWDYEKNKDISIDEVVPNSDIVVFWKCHICGHESQESIKSRVRNSGCRKCKAKKRQIRLYEERLKNPNNLEKACPDLVKEWDYKKNGDLKPSMFLKTSKDEVWWKCSKCGHSWKASIGSRGVGSGCPKCPSRLGTSFPEQAIYYYLLKAFPDAENSYHEFFKNGSELDIYIPSLRVGIEYDGKAWHSTKSALKKEKIKYEICKKNNVLLIRIKESVEKEEVWCDKLIMSHYDNKKYGTLDSAIIDLSNYLHVKLDVDLERDFGEVQKQYLELLEKNSVAALCPDLVKEWDYKKNGGLSPSSVIAKSSNEYWWKCKHGHSFKRSAYSRYLGSPCPICSNRQLLIGYNDLESQFPDISKEWDYSKNKDKPSDYVFGSPHVAHWKCLKCGYEWKTAIRKRTKDKTGCPECAKASIGIKNAKNYLKGNNSLKDIYPKVCLNWDFEKNGDLVPEYFVPGSGRKVHWKCHICGHELIRPVREFVRTKHCPNCHKLWNE